MEKELSVLGKALSNPDRPFTAIIGGSKVKDKIDVIDNLLTLADNVIIGGGLAYTFFKAQGHEIGQSLLDKEKLDVALGFIEKAKELGKTSTCRKISSLRTSSAQTRIPRSLISTAFLPIGKALTSDLRLAPSMQK